MFSLLLCLFICISNSLNPKFIAPKKLWGKKIMVNGPGNQDKNFSPFDGKGHITSVVFTETETVVSEVHIPTEKGEKTFPISAFFKRNYFSLLYKLPYVFFNKDSVQSGTRNTAVLNYDNKYYAVEESCSPINLIFNQKDELVLGNKSSIPIMAVHMADNYTIFSYKFGENKPLKINSTYAIPWAPPKLPFLVHDCKRIKENYFIFPLMSSGIGKFYEYFQKKIDMPLDDKSDKAGWLLYNSQDNTCNEIKIDEYADIFHIADIKHIYGNLYKIYAPFVYNFPIWMSGKGDLIIRLKECIIDIEQKKVIQTIDTGLKMDFIHTLGNELIGSCLDDKPAIIKYNMVTKDHVKLNLPGDIVREIIPYEDYLLYFSHSANNSYLYIVNITNGDVINQIEVPHRLPGFHTTLFD